MDASGSSSSEIGMGYINFVATNTAPNTTFGNERLAAFKENFIVTGGTRHRGMDARSGLNRRHDERPGFAGRAALNIGAFKDDIELRSSEPFWDNGNSDPISTDRQRQHGGSTSSFDENLDRTVSDMITFSVPITLGEPFNLASTPSATQANAQRRRRRLIQPAGHQLHVNWAGAQIVDAGGTAINGAAILTGDTGLNWTSGPMPCPPDLHTPFGVPNFFDVSAFITAFTAQDPAADFAAPFGSFDFFDVSAFITAYNAGCP
ncbi:MAG: GC-type dockerin domain-anchored protein [Phycisphaerales bacterium]